MRSDANARFPFFIPQLDAREQERIPNCQCQTKESFDLLALFLKVLIQGPGTVELDLAKRNLLRPD